MLYRKRVCLCLNRLKAGESESEAWRNTWGKIGITKVMGDDVLFEAELGGPERRNIFTV